MRERTLSEFIAGAVSYGMFGLSVFFWLFVLYRLVSYPENHVGWNILFCIPMFLVASASSTMAVSLTHKRHHIFFVVTGILSIALVLACYRFNVLIPYELWMERGMPSRPF